MTTTAKVILGVVVGLVILCLCAAVAGFALFAVRTQSSGRLGSIEVGGPTGVVVDGKQDSVRVQIGGAETGLVSQPPAGWTQTASVNLGVLDVINYDGPDGHSHITLMRVPNTPHLSEQELRQHFADANVSYQRLGEGMKPTGERVVTVRGQSVTFFLGEGLNHDGVAYRTMLGSLDGADGATIIAIAGPISTWSDETFDTFLASIK